MVAAFTKPEEALAPATARVRREFGVMPVVLVELSHHPLAFPHAGLWRSFAETDPDDLAQIESIANRYGGLTAAAASTAGEPVHLWVDLIETLRTLSAAWTATGKRAEPQTYARVRWRARQLLAAIVEAPTARFTVVDDDVALVPADMRTLWTLEAIHDAQRGEAMARCRHCQSWFSLAGLRVDTGFCRSAHRSAYHQKRLAPAFWAEAT
jgi:hypothetical protein